LHPSNASFVIILNRHIASTSNEGETQWRDVKLPAHRAGLPGNEISFLIVPLDPAYKAGLAGYLPVKDQVCGIS
jgi:hypothetical protein